MHGFVIQPIFSTEFKSDICWFLGLSTLFPYLIILLADALNASLRNCVPQKTKYIYIYIFSLNLYPYLTHLFIDFWRKATLTHARVFLLHCCYFTKTKLFEHCTIHFNMGSKPCHHNHSNKMKCPSKIKKWIEIHE